MPPAIPIYSHVPALTGTTPHICTGLPPRQALDTVPLAGCSSWHTPQQSLAWSCALMAFRIAFRRLLEGFPHQLYGSLPDPLAE